MIWAVSGCLLVFVGCSGQKTPDGMPPLHPCVVMLTMDGQPFDGASVTLHPMEGGYTAGGTTNAAGKVEIMTSGKYRGAPLGKYKVTITKTDLVFDPGYEPENIKITPSGDEVQDRKTQFYIAQNHSKHVSLVDPMLLKKDETPLELEVQARNNRFEFAIKPPSE
jgi:hypothetical protein